MNHKLRITILALVALGSASRLAAELPYQIAPMTTPEGMHARGHGVYMQVIKPDGFLTVFILKNNRTAQHTGSGEPEPSSYHYVPLEIGDMVTIYDFEHVGEEIMFSGVPDVWLSGFAGERRFMCSPHQKPGEPYPYIPWEHQTHNTTVNKYPDDFKIYAPEWQDHATYSEWSWLVERRTALGQSEYSHSIEYPIARDYQGNPDKPQREGQTWGWQKEFMHYWKTGAEYNALAGTWTYVSSAYSSDHPHFTLTADSDEYLQLPFFQSGHAPVYVDNYYFNHRYMVMLAIKKFDSFGQANWMHLWPDETTGNSVNAKTYTDQGFPDEGFILNDYMEQYFQYKTGTDEYFGYEGYEIEDFGAYRRGEDMVPIGGQIQAGDYWSPNLAVQNNRHPGGIPLVISGTDDVNPHSILLSVTSPGSLAFDECEDFGFYHSIECDQWPMYLQDMTVVLKGLPSGLSAHQIGKYSLVLEGYLGGKGTTTKLVTKTAHGCTFNNKTSDSTTINHPNAFGGGSTVIQCNSDNAVYDSDNGTLTATFTINNGWCAVVAYYNGAIFAGRDLTVQKKVGTISAPGSNSNEYSDETLSLFNSVTQVDLKAGRGLRAYEEISDLRLTPSAEHHIPVMFFDPNNGEHNTQYGKYINEYTFPMFSEVNFAAIDVGRNWSQAFDPYTSWRAWTRKIPLDIVEDRLNFSVYYFEEESDLEAYETSGLSIEEFSDGDSRAVVVSEVSDASMLSSVYQCSHQNQLPLYFPLDGHYLIKVLYEPADGYSNRKIAQDYFGGEILVSIVDYASYDAASLNEERKRATIKMRQPTETEFLMYKHVLSHLEIDGVPSTNKSDYTLFEFDDLLSNYEYVLGPRASNGYKHRFGSANDFNREFAWDVVSSGLSTNRFQLSSYMPITGLGPISLGDICPANWNNTFYRHVSSNLDMETDLGFQRVFRTPWDYINTDYLQSLFNHSYAPLTGGYNVWGDEYLPKNLYFTRWLPWIAESPTEGFRINLWVKTVIDLRTFFNGDETGSIQSAWSGQPNGKTIPLTTLGSEYWSPVGDIQRDYLENIYDIIYGRKFIIYSSNLTGADKVVLYNVNPQYPNHSTGEEQTGPDYIYLDEY